MIIFKFGLWIFEVILIKWKEVNEPGFELIFALTRPRLESEG